MHGSPGDASPLKAALPPNASSFGGYADINLAGAYGTGANIYAGYGSYGYQGSARQGLLVQFPSTPQPYKVRASLSRPARALQQSCLC